MRNGETGLTLILGNMFGGKTSELIHILKAYERRLGSRSVQAFKIPWDNRYGNDVIKSHDGANYPVINIQGVEDMDKKIRKGTKVVAIDEIQFFEDGVKKWIDDHKSKYRIVITALQKDFRGNPFPLRSQLGKEYDSNITVADIMPEAQIISKYSECTNRKSKRSAMCGRIAIFIQRYRLDGSLAPFEDPTVVVGGSDRYAPRCDSCFILPEKSKA